MTFRKISLTLFVTGFILFLGLAGLWLLLPGLLENRILPELALKNGIGWRQGCIHHIGLTGFDAGAVVIGRDDEAGLVVDAIHVDYTPWGLYKKRIDGITISGLSLNVSIDDNGVAVRGIEFAKAPASSERLPLESSAASTAPTVDLRNIRLGHATLNLEWRGRKWQIPFDLTARLEPAGRVDAMLTLRPCGEKVMVSARWRLEDARGDVSLRGQSLSLQKMATLAGAVTHALAPDLKAAGMVDIRAGATVRLDPLAVEGLVFSLASDDLNVHLKGIDFAAAAAAGQADKALYVNVQQTDDDRFDIKAGNLTVPSPVAFIVESLSGDVVVQPHVADMSLQAVTRLPASTRSAGHSVLPNKELLLTTAISGRYAAGGDWRLAVSDIPAAGARTPTPLALTWGNVRVDTGVPSYQVRVRGTGGRVRGTGALSVSGIAAGVAGGTVRAGKLVLKGEVAAQNPGGLLSPDASVNIQVSGIDAVAGEAGTASTVRVVIPEIRGRAEMHGRKGSAPIFTGCVDLAESSLAAPAFSVILSGITARIPWEWPVQRAATKGLISVARMQWKHLDMGSLGMTVGQQREGLVIEGHHLNKQLPELSLDFSAGLRFPAGGPLRAQASASLSRPATAAEIDLGRFVEGAAGIHVKGALHGEFEGAYAAEGMHASACAGMDGAAIRIPDRDLAVENLNTEVCFPDLPHVTTGPSQVLTFDRATMGNFNIENGRFHFQMEPHRTLFVEKGRLGWCGGQIRLQPMRITPGIDAYDLRLDCDRLNLAAILEQLAVADARGDGTVNGSIPVSIERGRIHFQDGFLYSTPGDGGRISLHGTDALMAGIPKGTRQYFQVDLAREALKDFDYEWAKLRLVSEKETLRMRLQFNGKPGRILPFEYDETFGGFARVGADSRGSEFQGISLDVNFKVPLNDLLAYRNLLELLR